MNTSSRTIPTRRRRASLTFAAIGVLAVASQALAAAPPRPDDAAPAADEAASVQVVEIRAAARPDDPRSSAATGLALSRRETPQSVSVITRKQLDDFQLDSVNRVLALTPGVTVESVETDRTYYTARGFDITNFQVDGSGMPFTNGSQWGDLDTALFERIDILRGANGLQSSTGNPSATIDFIRKRPTARWQGSAATSAGSWNGRRVEGDLSGPLTTGGRVRARLIAVGDRSDSYLDRYSRLRTVFSGQVDIDLARDTLLSMGFAAQRNDAKGPLWGALPLTYRDGTPTHYRIGTSTAADWTYWNNDDRRAYAELTHRLGDHWEAKATFDARHQSANSALFYVYGLPDAATGLGLAAYPSLFDGQYGQRVADLRLNGSFELGGRRHDLVLGLGEARATAREHSRYGGGIGDPVPDLTTWDGHFTEPTWNPVSTAGSDFDTHRHTVFAAAYLHATDDLALVVGANATRLRARGQSYGTAHAADTSAVTPYLGTVWDFSRDVSAYASFTRIFNPQVETDVDHRVLAPIRGSNAEAGLKGAWFGQRLSASAAVFRAKQANTATAAGVYPASDPLAGQSYHVGEDDTSTGVEFEVAGRIAPGCSVNGGYTQLALKHAADGTPARTFIPRRTLRLATTWTPAGAPGFSTGAALKWQSAVVSVDPSAGFVARQGEVALLDLMAAYGIDRHWSVGLHVDNATNRRHLASLYWTQAFYGEPRKVTASARYAF